MAYTPVVNRLYTAEQGGQSFIAPAGWVDAMVLAANTEEHYHVDSARTAMGLESDATLFVIFSADAAFYVNYHATSAVPATEIADGSGPELNPTNRIIFSGITEISFIAPTATTITMSFYTP